MRFLSGGRKQRDAKAASAANGGRPKPSLDAVRYPPVGRGVPFYDPADLVQHHAELVHQIRLSSGATDQEFAQHYLLAIHRYAAFVHALPASESHHHRAPGGMLRHGIEVGFHALRMSDGKIFSRTAVRGNDRNDEPRWRFAAFIAGLCHDIGKVVGDMDVLCPHHRLRWNPFQQSLYEWGCEHELESYHPQFRKERVHGIHETLTASCIDRILTTEHRVFLSAGHPNILTHMMLALQGSRAIADNIVYDLMHQADQASVSAAIANDTQIIDGISVGLNAPEKWIATARRLVGKQWKPNKPGGTIFVSKEGVFLAWPNAHNDVVAALESEAANTLPADAQVMAGVLVEHGLATPHSVGDSERRLVRIIPQFEATSVQQPRWALQLANGGSIFNDHLPEPISLLFESDGATHEADQPSDDSFASEEATAENPPPDDCASSEPPPEPLPSHDAPDEASPEESSAPEAGTACEPPQAPADRPAESPASRPAEPSDSSPEPHRNSVIEGDDQYALRLRQSGAGGRALASVIDATRSGDLVSPTHVFAIKGKVYLDLRAIADELGIDPQETGTQLSASQLVEVNPKRPTLILQRVDDATGNKRTAAPLSDRGLTIFKACAPMDRLASPATQQAADAPPTPTDDHQSEPQPASATESAPDAPDSSPTEQPPTPSDQPSEAPDAATDSHLPATGDPGASQPEEELTTAALPPEWPKLLALAERISGPPGPNPPPVVSLGDYLCVHLSAIYPHLKNSDLHINGLKAHMRTAGPRVFKPQLGRLGFKASDTVYIIAREPRPLSNQERNTVQHLDVARETAA